MIWFYFSLPPTHHLRSAHWCVGYPPQECHHVLQQAILNLWKKDAYFLSIYYSMGHRYYMVQWFLSPETQLLLFFFFKYANTITYIYPGKTFGWYEKKRSCPNLVAHFYQSSLVTFHHGEKHQHCVTGSKTQKKVLHSLFSRHMKHIYTDSCIGTHHCTCT